MFAVAGEDPYEDDDPLVRRPDRLEPVRIKDIDTDEGDAPPVRVTIQVRRRQSRSQATQRLLATLTNGNHPEAEAAGAEIDPSAHFIDEDEIKDDSATALGFAPPPRNTSPPPLDRPNWSKRKMRMERSAHPPQDANMTRHRHYANGLNISNGTNATLPTPYDPVRGHMSHDPHCSERSQAVVIGSPSRNALAPRPGSQATSMRNHMANDAPVLPPLNQMDTSLPSRGSHSPTATMQLPGVEHLFKCADDANKTSRPGNQRQRSLSGRSSVSVSSPGYALSSSGSPHPNGLHSPGLSHLETLSPRESSYPAPYFTATSPPYTTHDSAARRISPYSPHADVHTTQHSYPSMQSLATSPDASSSNAATSPSERHPYHRDQRSYALSSSSRASSVTAMAALQSPVQQTGTYQTNGSSTSMLIRSRPNGKARSTSHESETRSPTRGNAQSADNQYHCDFPGCEAQPFHTQYLLNSHKTVHSDSRPHYCSIENCSRSIIGQGFKRKNEMIRHMLVHESPGYICPYCPSREHRYPRPDNLQRHVKAHHKDVPGGDSRLREVLDRKQAGRAVGRKKKSK